MNNIKDSKVVWDVEKSKHEDLQMYSKNFKNWKAFKIETIINKKPQKIIPYLFENELALQWRNNVEKLQEVESFGADLKIIHESNKKMGAYTDPRDFVYAEYRNEMENVLEVFQTSVEH